MQLGGSLECHDLNVENVRLIVETTLRAFHPVSIWDTRGKGLPRIVFFGRG